MRYFRLNAKFFLKLFVLVCFLFSGFSPAYSYNNSQIYPAVPLIYISSFDSPFSDVEYDSKKRALRWAYNQAKEFYRNQQYEQARKELDKVLVYYPNVPLFMLFKSQIEDVLGNNSIALEYANNILNYSQSYELYAWRAYLLAKSGKESNLNGFRNDINNAILYTKLHPNEEETERYEDYKRKKLQYYPILWAYIDDKSIPTTMKAEVYKALITNLNKKQGLIESIPVTASYIQFIFSLDNSDPLFAKLGKSKNDILSSYIALQNGQYTSFIKGIATTASGNTRVGLNQILNAFSQTNDNVARLKYITAMVGDSLRILRPTPRKIDSYGIGLQIGYDANLRNIKITKILNQDLISKGIREGDVITSINGKNLYSINDINQIGEMMRGKKDTTIELEIPRIPEKIVAKRNYHTQQVVYDYFYLPKSVKINGSYTNNIRILPYSSEPCGMIMHPKGKAELANPSYNQYTM